MTVYKPIQEEADLAAKAALALCAGDDPTEIESDFEFDTIGINISDGKAVDSPEGDGSCPIWPTGRSR